MSDDDLEGGVPGVYARQPSRVLLGCVLAPVLFMSAAFAIGAVVFAGLLALGALHPSANVPVVVAIAGLVTLGPLALFFGTVARRLIASMRGRDVPHLMPPIVALVLAIVLGLAGVIGGVAALATGKGGYGAGRGMGVGIVFLVYAARTISKRRAAKVPRAQDVSRAPPRPS